MEKELTGYKVVLEKWNGILVSPAVEWTSSMVKYEEGAWVGPNSGHGPLCVFSSLRHLKQSSLAGPCRLKLRVFRCRYKPEKNWKEAWVPGHERTHVLLMEHGVELASGIKLVKEIKGVIKI